MSRRLLALASLGALAAGGLLHLVGQPGAGSAVWAAATAAILLPLVVSVARSLVRGDVGVDAIALVAIASALALGQYLAGAVVALMLAGGNALEEYATRRAGRELAALLERMPRIAHRRCGDVIEEVAVDELRVGDVVVVRAGEVVPVDGAVRAETALLDEAALTGEAVPVRRARGGEVRSGSANAGDAFERTSKRAEGRVSKASWRADAWPSAALPGCGCAAMTARRLRRAASTARSIPVGRGSSSALRARWLEPL
jgi:cation transport ATPase